MTLISGDLLAPELYGIPSYPAPMQVADGGKTRIIYDDFLKDMINRVRNKNYDLSLRKLSEGSWVVELVVREHSYDKYQTVTLVHTESSQLANDHLKPLRTKIDEYRKLN